ncbi:DUF1127 domain-containing protein [Roseomonas populi]|uniref:DUF1127 domain-containing protein n=1 Tax=Roseomonas populi TaxID=3121582 RepID=A0ABT1XC42_9PROT|nr:DUF1127 domain-containing protein [Roseomonas pecuniae]MCR0985306.1 DUF1127 domain-containing protein [Roseomonas pecuniae]
MSTTINEAAHAPTDFRPARALRELLTIARQMFLARRTARALEALDDAQLKDIGLSRSVVPSVAGTVASRGTDAIWGPAALDGAAPILVRLRGI